MIGKLLLGAMITLGGDHHCFRDLESALLFPAIAAIMALKDWSRWSFQGGAVESRFDEAQVAHGAKFEELSAADQGGDPPAFLAIDRHSHSASDTLYGVFPFFVCTFLLVDWIARSTRRS